MRQPLHPDIMPRFHRSQSKILSSHRFTRPGIRLWLPAIMVAFILLCTWIAAPRIRVIEFIAIVFLAYVAISSLVSVCEITVVEDGLIIDRLLLPERFVPWSAVDRVVVFSQEQEQSGLQLEVASIGFYEGLSPLNRLPGPVYGQGFRQTIIITPEALHDYDILLSQLQSHCAVVRRDVRR